jgi:hypothetical protein
LVFFSNGGYPNFRPYHCGGWKGGLSSPLPSCAMSKMTLGHNPKGWWALALVWAAWKALNRPSSHSPHEEDTQHSPPSDSCGGQRHARCLATHKQLILWQYLGQHIRAILVGIDVLKLYQLGTYHLSNPMTPHFNMLGLSVETWILGKMDSALTITI